MKMIAAVDKNWGIGFENRLLFSIPADMHRFRELTEGNTVLMGRNTFLSLPGQKALKNRKNIVLTHDGKFRADPAVIVTEMEEALEEIKNALGQVYVIGGGSVYRQFLPLAEEILITYVDAEYQADTRFPNLDRDDTWELVWQSERQTDFEAGYYFRTYRKR